MTILFLDIDGVTHPWPTSKSGMFDAQCLLNLNNALLGFSIDVVISSTWRESMHIEEIRQRLREVGKLVCDVTPVIDEPFLHHVRYHEVNLYLEQSGKLDESWVAIDDEKGNFPDHLNNILITNRKTGFNSGDIERLRKMLIG